MKASDLKDFGEIGHGLSQEEAINFLDSKIRFITERCRDKKVLDLGCVMHNTSSYHSQYFLHRAIREVADEVIGLDLHQAGVEALLQHGYKAVVGDAENFSFADPFDVIVAGDLIEHLGNQDGFLASCLDALKPEGIILIQTPNPWYWRNVVKAVLHTEVPNNPEHTCWFDPRTLRQLVSRYGLTLGRVEFQSRYPRDRLMPLPRGLKHTSWAAEIRRA